MNRNYGVTTRVKLLAAAALATGCALGVLGGAERVVKTADPNEVAELRQRVSDLSRQMKQMEKRLMEVERERQGPHVVIRPDSTPNLQVAPPLLPNKPGRPLPELEINGWKFQVVPLAAGGN
ncbi:MAG TPA: hypothetical protein VHH73_15100 [Verrucomicrobiae bacterium]|nr:hypothetical protein [Verrucomicrobiae bacterium]